MTFFLLTKGCVRCWWSGVKERNWVFWCSSSRLLDVINCQEVLAELKCLEQHVLDCALRTGKLLASRNHLKLCPCPQSWTQIQRDDSLKNRKTDAEGSLTEGIISGHKVGKWSWGELLENRYKSQWEVRGIKKKISQAWWGMLRILALAEAGVSDM